MPDYSMLRGFLIFWLLVSGATGAPLRVVTFNIQATVDINAQRQPSLTAPGQVTPGQTFTGSAPPIPQTFTFDDVTIYIANPPDNDQLPDILAPPTRNRPLPR